MQKIQVGSMAARTAVVTLCRFWGLSTPKEAVGGGWRKAWHLSTSCSWCCCCWSSSWHSLPVFFSSQLRVLFSELHPGLCRVTMGFSSCPQLKATREGWGNASQEDVIAQHPSGKQNLLLSQQKDAGASLGIAAVGQGR